ncbi:AAA family ATPase [Actinacidiphila sp. bgisy167]|uniref:AAA family ATPase n=1 Tax=Actinacidiphila sp. bgisy167 TaxID=3413797 RepID=UPI003D70DF76
MTESENEQPQQDAQHDHRPGRPVADGQALSLAETVAARLAEAKLGESVKTLLKEALGDAEPSGAPSVRRVYLDSVAVTGFRGIGPKAWLTLNPRPGVTLVVGRNGSGKSSIAEGVESAFTGTNMRWQGQDATRSSNWRNLHDGAKPVIEVKLAVEGDTGRSTLTRAWKSEGFADSEGEFRRPGHGCVPADRAPWLQALTDYRPFLSYADLDRMLSGKPSQMYDAIASILGLGHLSAADNRLQKEEKELGDAAKAVKSQLPEIKQALYALEDDDRAVQALLAVDEATYDFETLDGLVAGLPTTDEGLIAELRAAVDMRGPDMTQVHPAVERLRLALAESEDVRATGAEDALQRADLLTKALDHATRHPDEEFCPVCGSGGVLDDAWAESATAQIAVLRDEAQAAEDARRELRSAVREVHNLIEKPQRIPAALADPWSAWLACRTVSDPAELARRAGETAATLADACASVKEYSAKELEQRDERWRRLVSDLASWTKAARATEGSKERLADIKKARSWIKKLSTELRERRMEGFAEQSQRIWERLRQESSIDLKSVNLQGSEKAVVRKLVMDVSVDGKEASALSVMSQGEQHSLALSLFLPRATTADSPFGFVVIDDPVQSMDPAKVHGLAQVLHDLGEHRQVVVFTHDTRLQRAFASQELPVTVFEVERDKHSKVKVKPVTDPVKQALKDARALASTKDLPVTAQSHVLPSLCRIALENAFVEAAWIRHYRSGGSEQELQAAITDSDRLLKVAAVALLGHATETEDDVFRALAVLCGPRAEGFLKQCQRGAHPAGARITDPHRFVDEIEAIVAKVRKPEVTA